MDGATLWYAYNHTIFHGVFQSFLIFIKKEKILFCFERQKRIQQQVFSAAVFFSGSGEKTFDVLTHVFTRRRLSVIVIRMNILVDKLMNHVGS